MMQCFEWFEAEFATDSLISDPVMGFLGALIAWLIVKRSDHFPINDELSFMNHLDIAEMLLLALPSVLLLDVAIDYDMHWLYTIALSGMIALVARIHAMNPLSKGFIGVYIYLLGVTIIVNSTEGHANSLHMATVWAVVVALFTFYRP